MPPRTRSIATFDAGSPRRSSAARRSESLHQLPRAARILGIDPGLRLTGYGVIDVADAGSRNAFAPSTLIEGGVLQASPADSLALRLLSLHQGLLEVLREHRPDVMVIEELFSVYKHPRSALLMAHARGVLLLAAEQMEVPAHHFLPNEVKQVLTGNGHAAKSSVQAAVRSRLNLKQVPEPADVSDALALAICFAVRQRAKDR